MVGIKNVDRISFFGYNVAERLVFSMLVKYSYVNHLGKKFGFFQCDMEDFRKFWLSRKDTIKAISLIKGQRVFVYSFKLKKWLCVSHERMNNFPYKK